MRFGNTISSRSARTFLIKKKMFQKILVTNLGLTSVEAEKVLKLNKNNLHLPRHQIIANCLMCQKYNIAVKPLKDFNYCLILNTYKLEHRINILKDIGVPKLNVSFVTRIRSFLQKHVTVFKQETDISPEQDVQKNIFNRLKELSIDVQQLQFSPSDDNCSMWKIYEFYLLNSKTTVFHLPNLDDKFLLQRFMKYKSISMIAETLEILRNDLEYDDKMINAHPVVILASASNIRSLLSGFKDTGICGLPIKTFLKKYPQSLFGNVENMKQLLISFKRYEITDEYVKKCPLILRMGNDTFIERIEGIKKHPYLHIWDKHPRILQLILHKNMANDRIDYLDIINRTRWARLHTVLTDKNTIDKYIQYGASTVMSKNYLKHVFAKELGPDKVDLVEKLTRHQYWKTAGYTDIEYMLKYLKADFTISEICHNIHLVLYTRSVIEKLLNDLKQQYSQSTEFSFTNSQYLSLCLYTLEKDSHFTGDGIWTKGHNVKQDMLHLLKNSHTTERSDDDKSSMEDTNDDSSSEDSNDSDVLK